jgi:branched-chain amino acid transport system substrate-binding protein
MSCEEKAWMGEDGIQLAFVAPLTGDESIVGVPMMHIVELAVESASANFPFSIQLLALDDRARPDVARELARSLVEDHTVVGVVGHKNSGPSYAAAPLYAAAGLAQITPSSTNSDLARQGWSTFFRVCADNDRQAVAAASYALQGLGARRVTVVHDGTAYGWPLAERFVTSIEERGGQVVLVESVELGQKRFAETARRLGDAHADLIYFGLTEIESSLLINELRAAGIMIDCLGADGGRQSPFPRLAGVAGEGCYETYAGVDAASQPRGRAFLDAFEARFGPCPIFGPEVFDAASLLLAALRQAVEPTRQAVLEQLSQITPLEGVTGPVSFEPNGNRRDAAVSIWRVRHGAMEFVSWSPEE